MAINKAKKETILKEVTDILDGAETVTFVNFHGLGVKETGAMRAGLREAGVGYRVAKKTLTKKALETKKLEGELPELSGELAIAYGKETAPAREVYTFSKKHKDALEILGGIFEGRFLGKEEMMEIAQIPSLDVLRGMFVNVINSPIQRAAIALGEIAKSRG